MEPLPYVPPLKSAHSCRLCQRWLEGEWAEATPEEQAEIQRQMDAGRCDDCTRRVAVEIREECCGKKLCIFDDRGSGQRGC